MPRAYVDGAGLSGPGQDRFPHGARESGRDMGLIDDAVVILENQGADDGAGAPGPENWQPAGDPVRGRIDPQGQGGSMFDTAAGRINETSTHIVSMDPDTVLTEANRLRVEGKDWLVLGVRDTSDALILQAEVHEVP